MKIEINIPEHFIGKAWLLEQIKELETLVVAGEYGMFKIVNVYRGVRRIPGFILRVTTLDEGQSVRARVAFHHNNLAYIDQTINPRDRVDPRQFPSDDYIEKWQETTWSRGLVAIICDINERLNQVIPQEANEINEAVKKLMLRGLPKLEDDRS